MSETLALYIHWPWCLAKCPYCDFNSHVDLKRDEHVWIAGCLSELEYYAALLPKRRITSIFFGGGTPSLMDPSSLRRCLDEIRAHWMVAHDAEITLEANPTTAEADRFAAFGKAGVNRLSLGVQSLRDEGLKFLGRNHGAEDAKRAIRLAAEHFPRFSFDLIYARHGQTADSWQVELAEALAFNPRHLSLYQLTIEPGTRFHTLAEQKTPLVADTDMAALMFEQTQATMRAAGLPAYEISNHAAPGEESRHNLAYWRYQDYIGVGPGAHSRWSLQGVRFASANARPPGIWQRFVREQGQGIEQMDELPQDIQRREALMMGLRLTEGVRATAWQAMFGEDIPASLPPERLEKLVREGLLDLSAEGLRATPQGLQRLDAVLRYLLQDTGKTVASDGEASG